VYLKRKGARRALLRTREQRTVIKNCDVGSRLFFFYSKRWYCMMKYKCFLFLFLFMLNQLRKLRRKILSLFSCLFIWLNDFVYTRWRIKNKTWNLNIAKSVFANEKFSSRSSLLFFVLFLILRRKYRKQRNSWYEFTSVHWLLSSVVVRALKAAWWP
jgi:hypothetical protein